jgi:RNA polymerase sigma-70 factor (ECF subfamily)
MNENAGVNPDDKRLVNRVLEGDSHAFAIIVANTEKLVAQIVFRMVENVEDRKDIAQDIYLKAYRKLAGFRFQSKLSTWIARIGYNTCLDYLRSKKPVVPFDMPAEESGEDMPDTRGEKMREDRGRLTDTTLIQKDISIIIRTQMEKLPPVQKTMITLYHNEGLNYEEIGEITGLPAGTVKSYLFRARKALRDNLLRTYKKEDLW